MDHIWRQDSQRHLHGGGVRLQRPGILQGLRQTGHADEGHGSGLLQGEDRGDGVQGRREDHGQRHHPHPRRGALPQPHGQDAAPHRRLAQIRQGRQRLREGDAHHEQLLQLSEARVREPQGDQVRQAGGLWRLLHVEMVTRPEIRAQEIDRLPFQQGQRNAEEPQIRRHVLENAEMVVMCACHLLPY